MKQSKRTQSIRKVLGLTTGMLLAVLGNTIGLAYDTYSGGSSGGCIDCHGDFRGTGANAVSPKGTVFPGTSSNNSNHEMHRNTSYMSSSCDLCHTGTSSTRKPVYTWKSNGTNSSAGNGLGCSGCHVGAGLRKHHDVNGVIECYGCHNPNNDVSDPENVNPPYYTGMWTNYTKVRNPGNTVMLSNTNENWSVGDFLGLDNDGNNLYDMADYAIGPKDRVLSSTREGNNIRVTWQTMGGRTNMVQAASKVSGTYANISSAITSTNVGLVTTNYLEVGGATNTTRFYRLRAEVP
jgi:hypothetical protein